MQPQDFWKAGISVIPVGYRTKKPLVQWLRYQNALPSEGEMLRWFRLGHQINAAVICGWKGLTVLDFDTTHAYSAWLAWAMMEGGTARQVALDTYRVKTSRGMHVYAFISSVPRCGHFAGGDIKAKGGYVLIPPSVHPSGHVYQAVDDGAAILSIGELAEVLPDPPEPPVVQLPPLVSVYAASALWPVGTIEEAKAALPILSLFPQARATGGQRWYVAHCPWHDDRNESMWIDAQRGLCGCYAGCTSKAYDSLDVFARLHGLDVADAVRELMKGA